VLEYVKKGHRVFTSGRISYSKYIDSYGQQQSGVNIIADDILNITPNRVMVIKEPEKIADDILNITPNRVMVVKEPTRE
jgi:single-stranded DNA-binding protein